MTLTTGISMLGKMSVGVRKIATGPNISSRIDITTNVYGLRNANRTIHIQGTLETSEKTRNSHRARLERKRPRYYRTRFGKLNYSQVGWISSLSLKALNGEPL